MEDFHCKEAEMKTKAALDNILAQEATRTVAIAFAGLD